MRESGGEGMTAVVPVLYPWDVLAAPRLPDELRSLGAERVIVAAQYHAVKAATPRHPSHQLIDARHTALYVGESFSVGALQARSPDWCAPDAFSRARELLRADGFAVDAWIAPSHDDGPEPASAGAHRVRNAFGDVLRHALCVSDPIAAEYMDRVVGAVLEGRPDGLVVESISQLGIDHMDQHDKSAGADWSIDQRRLLSVCFCVHCSSKYVDGGGDPQRMQADIRAAFGTGARERASALREALGPLVQAARASAVTERWGRVVDAARRAGLDPPALHATADDWATGPSTPRALLTEHDAGARPDAVPRDAGAPGTLIAHCWSDTATAVAGVRALADAPRAGRRPPRLAAYVSVLPPEPVDASALAAKWMALRDAGARELHIYHLGLASEQRLDAARHALRIVGRTEPARSDRPRAD